MQNAAIKPYRECAIVVGLTLLALAMLPFVALIGAVVYAVMLAAMGVATLYELLRAVVPVASGASPATGR